MAKPWSEEEDEIILNNPELNSQEHSKLLNRSQKAILNRRAKLRGKDNKANEGGNNNILITSDWHIPHYDKEMFSLLLNTAKENNTQELIIAGDFLNLDILSTFAKRETPISIDEELKEAEEAVLYADDYYPESSGVDKLKEAIEYFKAAAQKAGLWVSDEEAEKKVRVAYQALQRQAPNNLVWGERGDSNPQPLDPQSSALTG